jgi:hypothetical protein
LLSHSRHTKATLGDDIALDFIGSPGDGAGERTQEIEHGAAERLFRQRGEFLAIDPPRSRS